MVLKKYQVPGTVPSGKPPNMNRTEPYRAVLCNGKAPIVRLALCTYCAWSMGSGSCHFCLVYFWLTDCILILVLHFMYLIVSKSWGVFVPVPCTLVSFFKHMDYCSVCLPCTLVELCLFLAYGLYCHVGCETLLLSYLCVRCALMSNVLNMSHCFLIIV